MPLELHTIPCLSDNYAFLVHNAATGETAVFDVPEAAPVEAALEARGWRLTDIVLTHHHADHVSGVAPLREATGATVWGAAQDAARLPPLDREVSPGDTVTLCGEDMHVIDVSGHTIGHVAYHLPASRIAVTGDSLMAMGCGRLFEGTAPQMWDSLSRLAALPPDTTICSGHEYTRANARFAATIDPDNAALAERSARIDAARSEGVPTVPSMLAEEQATNPFLRAGDPSIRARLGLENASDSEVFAEIRRRKDAF